MKNQKMIKNQIYPQVTFFTRDAKEKLAVFSRGRSCLQRPSELPRNLKFRFIYQALTAAFAAMATPVFADTGTLPSGYVLAITGGTGNNTAQYSAPSQYQNYSVTFTPTVSGATYVLFSFRNDPDYWNFGNVSLTAAGSTNNLIVNPKLTQGTQVQITPNGNSGTLTTPAGWGLVAQPGTNFSVGWFAPTSAGNNGSNDVNSPTAGA